MHLGLIGGIGPAATESYYRGLVRAFAARKQKLDLTIVQAEVTDLLRTLAAGAKDEQAELYRVLLNRLTAAGADIAAITSLAGHFCYAETIALSPLPLVSAIDALAGYFRKQGIKRIGLLGTSTVLRTKLYGGTPEVEIVVPPGAALEATHINYTTMAMAGAATDEQRGFFFETGAKLCREQGAEAVLLAGTDLFLAFEGRDCGFPTIDAAEVHIEELVLLATQ